MSRAQLTSTVEQNTGGAVAPFVAGKNKIINGDFGIWQRGTSFSNPTTGTYTADRWYIGYENGTVTSSSVTQQTFTPGTAPVAGYEGSYFLRRTYTTLGTATLSRLDQKIEDVRAFAGQTVTISYWAKSNASVSVINYAVQNMGTGGSGGGAPSVGGFMLTSSWARYSFQIAIPSLAGTTIGTGSNLEIMFQLGNLSNGATFDLWGVQLEAGSVATPFTTATGTVQGELAACQRYYYRTNATNGAYGALSGTGIAESTTVADIPLSLPVTLRNTPTSIDYSTIRVVDSVNGFAVTSVTFAYGGDNAWAPRLSCTVSSGLTQYRPYFISGNNSTSAYIGLSAEL